MVHRSALVGIDMAEGDPAQLVHRDEAPNRVRYERKQRSQAGLEEQRLLIEDEELVEHEIGVCVVCGQAVDIGGDLGDVSLHDVLPLLAQIRTRCGRRTPRRHLLELDGQDLEVLCERDAERARRAVEAAGCAGDREYGWFGLPGLEADDSLDGQAAVVPDGGDDTVRQGSGPRAARGSWSACTRLRRGPRSGSRR